MKENSESIEESAWQVSVRLLWAGKARRRGSQLNPWFGSWKKYFELSEVSCVLLPSNFNQKFNWNTPGFYLKFWSFQKRKYQQENIAWELHWKGYFHNENIFIFVPKPIRKRQFWNLKVLRLELNFYRFGIITVGNRHVFFDEIFEVCNEKSLEWYFSLSSFT